MIFKTVQTNFNKNLSFNITNLVLLRLNWCKLNIFYPAYVILWCIFDFNWIFKKISMNEYLIEIKTFVRVLFDSMCSSALIIAVLPFYCITISSPSISKTYILGLATFTCKQTNKRKNMLIFVISVRIMGAVLQTNMKYIKFKVTRIRDVLLSIFNK